jgi:hypothetical protein
LESSEAKKRRRQLRTRLAAQREYHLCSTEMVTMGP